MTRTALVCLLSLLFLVPSAHGDEPATAPVLSDPAQAPEPFEERGVEADATDDSYRSVVVAKRLPEDPFLSDRSVSVVDAEALRRRPPRTTPEALWDSPGVFVQQTNTGGGSPILRGLIGPQNLILVDGVRLNNSVHRTGPTQYLNLIDPYSLRRIEVLRGPGSVLYGSDAMGGVIQAFPHLPAEYGTAPGYGGRAGLRYSSANRGQIAHAQLQTGYANLGLLGGLTYKAFSDLDGGRGIGEQPYTGYEDTSALGVVRYRFTGLLSGWTVSATYLMSRIVDAGRTDKLRDARSLQLYDNVDDLAYGRLHLVLRPIRTSGEVTLSYQHFSERKDSFTVADDLATRLKGVRDEVTAHTFGLDIQLVTRLLSRRLRLQYGAMLYRDWVDASQLGWKPEQPWRTAAEAAYPPGSSYDNYGGFLLLEGDSLRLRGGHLVRLSAGYRLHGMGGQAPARSSFSAVDFVHTGHVLLGGVQYLFRDQATAALTFSQGFRAPNLNEAVMVGDTGKYFHVPNADLGPERSDTVELLLRGRLGPLVGGCAFYLSLLHDLIRREETVWQGQTQVAGKPVAWNVNGGEGRLLGLEAWLDLALGHGVSFSGSLSTTWGEELVPGGEDVPLTRIPPLFGRLGLRYQTRRTGRWSAFVESYVRAAAHQDRLSPEDVKDVRIPADGTPGWWTWNANAGLDLPHFRLVCTLENLLDQPYKYHGSGFYASGLNAMLSAEAFF